MPTRLAPYLFAVLLIVVPGSAVASPASELIRAVRAGDDHAVHALLASDPQLDVGDAGGFTALHWAGILDRPRLVRQLLDAGAAVDVVGSDGGSALHWLCHHDRPDLALAMIAAGAEIDLANRWGRTPLHVAVRRGCRETATVLLLAGADPDAATHEGWTPLHVANLAGRRHLVDLLRRAGATVDVRDQEGRTPETCWRPRAAPVRVAPESLRAYTGRYALDEHHDLLVWLEGEKLRIREFAPDRLLPIGPATFACVAEPWHVRFVRGEDGSVTSVRVEYLRREAVAERRVAPRYVGSGACRACHPGAWMTWARSAHARAYWRLNTHWARALAAMRPRHADVTDPVAERRCRQCHVTAELARPRFTAAGWSEEEGVGCEACHGPASAHVQGGEPPSGGDICVDCHRQEFDRSAAWPQIAHPG